MVMYFTPVFNGFQFGLSYAPDNGEAVASTAYTLPSRTAAGATAGGTTTPAATHAEVYSAAVRYEGEIGDFGLTFGSGYLRVIHKQNTPFPASLNVDADQWNAGVEVAYGNWAIGGSYTDAQDVNNVAGTDIQSFDIGLSYWSDSAWSAGVYWLHEEIDYSAATGAVLVPTAGPGAAGGFTDEYDGYRLMGQYDLGPGVWLTGALGFDQFDDGAASRTYDTTMVGLGLGLEF